MRRRRHLRPARCGGTRWPARALPSGLLRGRRPGHCSPPAAIRRNLPRYFRELDDRRLRQRHRPDGARVDRHLLWARDDSGDIYTVAGTATRGFSGDGGPATAANLYVPGGAAIDPDGNLVIADTFNNRIRVIAASSGTFYGQAMTAGDIFTVAGDGHGLRDHHPQRKPGWPTPGG